MKKPFWEESYSRPGTLNTFGGGNPSQDIVTMVSSMKPGLTALDLGCGEGRNALFLAKRGFKTSAVDISASGIQKLKTAAGDSNLIIDAVVCDMREYDFGKKFDLIVCKGCLHLIKRDEWPKVILKMKQATATGGLHNIGVFTDTVPEPEDMRGLMVGLFREGELLDYYRDWEIIDTDSRVFEDEHPGGIRHRHSSNNIIARKKP